MIKVYNARKEWRKWFFKATKKEFSDFTSSAHGNVQFHTKSSSLQSHSQLNSSKTTKKFELITSTVSSSYTMTGDEGTLKTDMMKQRELDNPCTLQTVEEGMYDLATEAVLESDLTKIDFAKMEAKQDSKPKVDSHAKSIVEEDDVLRESSFAATVNPLDLKHGEPKVNQLYLQHGKVKGETEMKVLQQDKKQCLEQPIPSKLKEQRFAKDEASATKSALEMVSSIPL